MKKDIHNKLIKFGWHNIADWVVIEIEGKKEKVDEFLQGQLTSDINIIKDNGFQLSSICDHKGFVICDFIIHLNASVYKVILNEELADIFIEELAPFAQFYSVKFHLSDQKVVGSVTKGKSQSSLSYWHNEEYCLGLEIHDKNFDRPGTINENEWILSHKLAKILFLVSFDKGCYRGQEIVARMKYLGVDRRKFSTLITKKTFKVDESLKIIGKKIKTSELQIFNAIIKKDEINLIKDEDEVIDII